MGKKGFDPYKPGKKRRFSECKSPESPSGKHQRTHHDFVTKDPKTGQKFTTREYYCHFCKKILK